MKKQTIQAWAKNRPAVRRWDGAETEQGGQDLRRGNGKGGIRGELGEAREVLSKNASLGVRDGALRSLDSRRSAGFGGQPMEGREWTLEKAVLKEN